MPSYVYEICPRQRCTPYMAPEMLCPTCFAYYRMAKDLESARLQKDVIQAQCDRLKHMLNDIRAQVWCNSSDLAVAILRRIEDGDTLKRGIVGHCQHHESHDGKCVWCGVALKQNVATPAPGHDIGDKR